MLNSGSEVCLQTSKGDASLFSVDNPLPEMPCRKYKTHYKRRYLEGKCVRFINVQAGQSWFPPNCTKAVSGSYKICRQKSENSLGRFFVPIRNRSIARAQNRPSRISQTTRDCPRRMSPAENTFEKRSLVLGGVGARTLPRGSRSAPGVFDWCSCAGWT